MSKLVSQLFFFDENGKKIEKAYIDCYNFKPNAESFQIPINADNVKVFFSTEHDDHHDSDMTTDEEEEQDDDEEETSSETETEKK